MKLPESVEKVLATFDRMSLRERALTAGAALVAVLMTWTLAVMDPLTAKTNALNSEMEELQQSSDAAAQAAEQVNVPDVTSRLLEDEKQLQVRLTGINEQLASRSGGLIAPQRMVEVIHDVLTRQRGITLVSLQNKPVTALIEPVPAADGTVAPLTGPYVHRVELVIEGGYAAVTDYLQALETLPWRFYWRSLDLKTTEYPVNRVRIELSTLSLDKDWIGV